VGWQLSLLGRGEPVVDESFRELERIELAPGSFIDRVPGWVDGDQTLLEELLSTVCLQSERRMMYERMVDVPRLTAAVPEDGRHPLLVRMATALSRRYGEDLSSVTLAFYRDGNDSVAWHRDRELADRPTATVAIVSLGGPRRFLVRRAGGGPSTAFSVGLGDLMVMGGDCQRDFEHAVPKTSRAAPRMAVMFRPRSRD
jgi:alkylated DNA repair dioxygenase AlkB